MVDTPKAEKDTPASLPETNPEPAAAAPAEPTSKIRKIEFDGYKFELDEDLLDDVELLEFIDGIENGEKPALIITLLEKLIGADGYQAMKAYFVAKDGRFKMSKLMEIYQAIFENFDPKG